MIKELVPPAGEDEDLAWRAELTNRFASVRGFVELLADTIPWGGTDAGVGVNVGRAATAWRGRCSSPTTANCAGVMNGGWKTSSARSASV
ncbi:hypothetical protein [Spongiactinospora sp. TRM90649]|uniref:hypothetical protein n=1 Tax=Spongiactinospora sp. TRM90649 TaxID=3031114 RepID=UPI0023F7C9FC|nr:hypothetical protein [Spongiactinospora sp. TRM90649]MDF5751023.1 hypothetical protein [Spongiactinospora sp. TRM90649]